ncbi:MAG: HlyD family efflux transporter periplasmic adaptor subunit [Desulfobulbaceae bacterium]|nr:HlyD family efflux transporter periplasmic adaptor subunit [Desulfobulbaceae bacterium]
MVDENQLPLLRQELELFPAPATEDGIPTWTLHDPPANKFFLLGWPVFEILSRWDLGFAGRIVEAVNQETTLTIREQDVARVVGFLEQNFLLQSSSPAENQRIVSSHFAHRPRLATWLLHNYLFFRVPLVKPQRFLKKTEAVAEWFYSRTFFLIVLISTLAAGYLLSRQWDSFLHAFTAYHSLEGIVVIGCAIPFAKVIHELGHAFTAHRYGCRIPTMGFAMVVLTPMLYTDTNDAWKLTSRTQRLAIGIAGIAAELLLALAAFWLWILLPEGPLRGAAFILATTTWIMTIALNASPFMRFDGYFILSDFLRLPNLHQRSFAFGRWWLREWLFGLGSPPPEPVSVRLRVFLILFALAVWLYRLVVFFGIALMVYHYFFKALGIFLFAVEISWFIVNPMVREIAAWAKIKDHVRFNLSTFRSLLLLVVFVISIVIPWKGSINCPALLSAVREQQVSVPYSSMISSESAREMMKVSSGETLLTLSSPDIDQQISQVNSSTRVARWQMDQQTFDERLLNQGNLIRKRHDVGTTELSGLQDVVDSLKLRAPFDGVVVERNDEIIQGSWMPRKEALYIIADTHRNRVDAYVGEQELEQISVGTSARFIPDVLDFGVFNCRVTDIDRVNIPVIDEPILASTYGGPIASRIDPPGVVTPNAPLFRIRMDSCTPSNVPPIKLKGIAHIQVGKRSSLFELIRYTYALAIREFGF